MHKIFLGASILAVVFLAACSQEESFSFKKEGDLLSQRNFLNIAHRGASAHAPEHTMPAYELGKEMKGDFIEIDLQLSADEEIVAIHDTTVDRISDVSGKVSSFTLEELKELDIGSWFNKKYPTRAKDEFKGLQVLTLEEIIETFGDDINYYLEIKETKNIDKLLDKMFDVLRKYDLIEGKKRKSRLVIHSFQFEYLLKIHEQEPSIPLVQLLRFRKKARISEDRINMIKEYAIGIGLNHRRLSKKFVKKVKDSGLLIHPYTVNNKTRMRKIIEWGVTGMSTNFPDRLDEVLEELESGG